MKDRKTEAVMAASESGLWWGEPALEVLFEDYLLEDRLEAAQRLQAIIVSGYDTESGPCGNADGKP